MESTRSSDPSRVGAVWVTATGSFLLFAAAVVLVAVRWDSIPDGVKLGALAALSGACLLVGRPDGSPLSRRVPAAAGVLFHLGAFLAPVTAAAVLRHLEVPVDAMLLSLGVGSAALFHLLGRIERSVVLRWAAVAATVVATVGLGSLTPVPAAAWLVALAAGALAVRQHPAAVAWATLATIAPLAALLLDQTDVEVLDAVAGTGLTPGLVGVGAAVVLVGLTHRLRELPLLALAATALASGLAVSVARLEPAPVTCWLAAAAGFVLLEVAALLLRDDPFWHRPLDGIAWWVEGAALLVAPAGLVAALGLVLNAGLGFVVEPDLLAGAVFGLAAVGWFLADLRRHRGEATPGLDLLVGGGMVHANIGLVGALLGAAAAGTASLPMTAAVAGALAVVLVLSGRAGSPALVPVLVLTSLALLDGCAPAELTAAAAVAGAVLLALQATLHRRDVAGPLALISLVPAGIALAELAPSVDTGGTLVAGLLLAVVLGVVLDQARSGDGLGWVPRLAGTGLLLLLADQSAATVAVVSGTYVLLATVEAYRRSDALPLLGWAIGLPPLATSLALLAGLGLADCGIVLSVLAVGVAALGHRRTAVRLPMVATALSLAAGGLGLATLEPTVLATVLVLDGAVVLGLGLLVGHPALTIAGGITASLGIWHHLDLRGVEAVDAYALPVAVLLWLVATRAADRTASSWVTHAPAVALAGGTALAERLGGGPGEHALLAGLVGLIAVVEGGGRRLAAPLLLGTGLLVALTAYETTGVTAGVPTWAWLASGGTLLVGAGLAMERHELGPVETGRRLVDVVQENFR